MVMNVKAPKLKHILCNAIHKELWVIVYVLVEQYPKTDCKRFMCCVSGDKETTWHFSYLNNEIFISTVKRSKKMARNQMCSG